MTPRRYDVALIPCTSSKNPTGRTPATLYRGGPFSLMMRHAQQRTDRVIIMSAKYGLLGLQDPVSYYDAYLPDLDLAQRTDLVARIRDQLPDAIMPWERCISYLPKAYHDLLIVAEPTLSYITTRPYHNLGSLTLFKVLSNEILNYGDAPARR